MKQTVGLLLTLSDIGLSRDNTESLKKVAEKAMTTKHIAAVPVETSPDILVDAILKADQIGTDWKASHQ